MLSDEQRGFSAVNSVKSIKQSELTKFAEFVQINKFIDNIVRFMFDLMPLLFGRRIITV